jgi:hypothetical protein
VSWLREAWRRNALLTGGAAASFLLFLILIPAVFFDSTTILGINRWIKPMKFAISIAIFLATMAWLLGYLRGSDRAVRGISWVMFATMAGELVLITMQSARGVRSHFNIDSPFDGLVFSLMGMLITINTLAAAWALYLFVRRPSDLLAASLAGVRLGLAIFIVASLQGFHMAGRLGHSVGVHDGSPGLPFVNWSSGGGDLRVAHFFGLHALQVLPLLGFWMDRREMRVRWLRAAAAVYFLIYAVVFIQALAGRPLLAALR